MADIEYKCRACGEAGDGNQHHNPEQDAEHRFLIGRERNFPSRRIYMWRDGREVRLCGTRSPSPREAICLQAFGCRGPHTWERQS